MDAEQVLQDWLEIESDGSEFSCEESEESEEESTKESSGDEESPDCWREVPGLQGKMIL